MAKDQDRTTKASASRQTPQQQCARPLHFNLGAELAPQIVRYHESLQAAGIVGNSVLDTVRELLTMGLASVPGDQAEVARFDRLRILSETRRWVLGRVFESFKEMKQTLELNAALEPARPLDPEDPNAQ